MSDLARHVTPDVSEARLARQRAVIAERVASGRGRRRWVWLVVPAVCLAVVLAFVGLRHPGPSKAPSETVAGTVIEAPAGAPLPITLPDGSRVVLDPETKVSMMTLLPKDVRLNLDRGGVDLDVTHIEGRELVVVAAGYEVRVLGTRFSVRLHPNEGEDDRRRLDVHVTRGRVKVTRAGDPADIRILSAGETWSSTLDERPEAPTTASSPASATASVEATSEASAAIAASAPPAPGLSTSPRALAGSKELWAQAESARAARRFQDEAAALNTLRLRHRSDPRAGLAAFELGRLRQDTLHDPLGAAEAFADAIALAPSGPFREDAEARRVEALGAAGRREQCVEARAAFLSRYAGSIHRQRLSTMCERR